MEQQVKKMPLAAEALSASYGTSSLLPIEFFKQYPEELRTLVRGPIARTFLSSGTTRADRSQSDFSAEGLAVYRHNALEGFRAVLQHFFADPWQARGISLIPTVAEWPDSSLAQMVHWIGEEHRLDYWKDQFIFPDEPLWVFGTAFHFVNLIDDGLCLRLPPGSIIIETGGTKGRSRSVTREELYELIRKNFGVSKNHIVSEYGMCELASQAYDWVDSPNGPELALGQRWFRFPAHTPVSLCNRLSAAAPQGEGTLVVHDRLRIDYPWPIRTEDMVRLLPDGRFQLLGRIPFSPLKGCSMLAEQIVGSRRDLPMPETARRRCPPDAGRRAGVAHTISQQLLVDKKFWDLWLEELGSSEAVAWLKKDLEHSLPTSLAEWLTAAQRSQTEASLQRWLIIPPEAHSFAWLYPIFLGAVLGFDLHLRARASDKIVNHVRELLQELGSFAIWDASNRIGVDPLPPVDAVLLYGTDETIAAVRGICPVPVQGFGSSLTVSLVARSADVGLIWKDAFSLLQRGCMASRVLFVLQDQSQEKHLEELMTRLTCPSQPVGPLPLGLELALEQAAFALRCQGRNVLKRACEGAPLLSLDSFDSQKKLDDLLIERAMSLAIVIVPKVHWDSFVQWLPMQKNLHKIAVHDRGTLPITLDEKTFEIVEAGTANAPAWDGWHQKRPLFDPGS